MKDKTCRKIRARSEDAVEGAETAVDNTRAGDVDLGVLVLPVLASRG
jgi:hypothetical protein